jgi:glycosyltransferase involved in cell wall biosynthesis
MPVALLEAVAEDTVIVASEIGPHRFLLESDAAVGFEATDARSLVEAIKLSGEQVTKESLAVGRMEIRRKYSETQIASQWLDVLVDATSKSK